MTNMIKHIKQGENIGVAKQVQGAVVDVYTHPKFKGMYGFVVIMLLMRNINHEMD